jgi:hypothetical protein
MGILRGVTGLTSKVIKDRPWLNPGLDAALDLLPTLPPEPAVEHVLAHLSRIRLDIEAHVQATDAFGKNLTGRLDVLRWRAGYSAQRDDDGTRADLLALLGRTLVDRAWEVRGSGRATSVSATAAQEFHRLLHEADEVLDTAIQTAFHHPAAATARLWTAVGLGVEPVEAQSRFQEATLLRGSLFPAHWAMLSYLCRKWYGSDDAMFHFARTVARDAPAGDPVGAMLPFAHAEYFLSLNMFPPSMNGFKPDLMSRRARKDDLPAVLEASRRWVGDGTGPIPEHARSVEAHQLFAWYFEITGGQRDLARWHLERAHRRMNPIPWAYMPLPDTMAFRSAYMRLGLG